MPKLHDMLERMYRLAVWDMAGKQYLPVFDYAWENVTTYLPAEEAITVNTTYWLNDDHHKRAAQERVAGCSFPQCYSKCCSNYK